ncbi:hypothetical protein DENSPDRAFT_843602 [Dentipellis sp. KUC8613]|nr:hypothetical protein DENSPDRAFT_843602 [Dentipellis sp. KUC8613]
MDPAQAELLVGAVRDVWTVGCFGLSSLVLLFYDHILTFPDEFELIWKSHWSISKVIFLLNRYVPYIDTVFDVYQQLGYNMTSSTCHTFYTTGGWIMVFGARLSELIVAARTWAVWGGGRRIAFGLGTLFVTDLILVGVFVNDFLRSMEFSQPAGLLPVIRGCFVSKAKKTLYICYVIPLVYESIVIGLFLVKGMKHLQRRTSPLMFQVYRDGLLAFFFLLVSSVANVVVLASGPVGYTTLLTLLQRVIHVILTARIVLNIRRNAQVAAPVVFQRGDTELVTISVGQQSAN